MSSSCSAYLPNPPSSPSQPLSLIESMQARYPFLILSSLSPSLLTSPSLSLYPSSPHLSPLQVRLLYCSQEEAEQIFRAAWVAGQATQSHLWFAVGPALSGLGMEGLPKALLTVRPQGWRDEPRRRISKGVSVLTHGAMALRREYGSQRWTSFAGNCNTDGNQTQRVPDRIKWVELLVLMCRAYLRTKSTCFSLSLSLTFTKSLTHTQKKYMCT